MSERKNIDRLFQEKFKDFEAVPSEKVWKGIESKLKEKKERKVLPLWFKLSGIAAALLIGFFLSDGLRNGTPQNNVVIGSPSKPAQKDTDLTTTTIKDRNPIVTSGTVENSEKNQPENLKNGPSDNEKQSGKQSNQAVAESGKTNPNTSGNDRKTKIQSAENNLKQESNPIVHQSVKRHKNGKIQHNGQEKSIILQASENQDKAVANTDKKQQSAISNTSVNSTDKVVADANRNPKTNQNPDAGNRTNTEGSLAKNKTDTNQKPEINSPNTNGSLAQNNGNANEKSTAVDTRLPEPKNQIVTDTDIKKMDSTGIATVAPNALEELLNEKENKTVTANEPKVNRWQITTNVAPIYLSSTSNGSTIDSRFDQNEKDYKTNLSYGLGVRYAINKKFSIRTGVNTIGLEYSTSQVVFSQSTNASKLEHVTTNLQGSLLQIENKNGPDFTEINPSLNSRKFEGNLNQKTGYVEIPLELSYKVLDKKFGVEIVGGMSTLLLNKNEVTVSSAGDEMEIGKANNLNSTHFSTNVGLSLKYNFLKSFQFNFEPMFKYQINTFTDSGNFKPYFFGLYSGINYRF